MFKLVLRLDDLPFQPLVLQRDILKDLSGVGLAPKQVIDVAVGAMNRVRVRLFILFMGIAFQLSVLLRKAEWDATV